MSLFNRLLPTKLSSRLLAIVLAASLSLTLITSSFLIYTDYKKEVRLIEENQIRIQKIDLKELSLDIWEFNWPKAKLKLHGLLNYPEVVQADIVLSNGKRISEGNTPNLDNIKIFEYALIYRQRELGSLLINIDKSYLLSTVTERAFAIVTTQFLNILAICVLIMIMVHRMITRHLDRLAASTRHISFDTLEKADFKLDRTPVNDELEAVTNALNSMREGLNLELQKRKEIEKALNSERKQLAELNVELENKVEERTSKLQSSNAELTIAIANVNEMISQLQESHKELIIKEKRLATGGMVAGLAHELNTPLGICKTSLSSIADFANQIQNAIEQQSLTKELLNNNIDNIKSLSQMSEGNIDHLSAMIMTFKELSVEEESGEVLEEVAVKDIFEDCYHWAESNLRGGIEFRYDSESNLNVETFRYSLRKVLLALIENATLHAFDADQSGEISLNAYLIQERNAIIITVDDNGSGIKEAEREKIFEPFYTTIRNKGGLGLGLNIVFNLVTQALGGSIECKNNPNGGCRFELTLPIELSHSDHLKHIS